MRINVTFERDATHGLEQVEHEIDRVIVDGDKDLVVITTQGNTVIFPDGEWKSFAVTAVVND